jgi:protein-S-isoprenylcysteine O-methyltransferase Ste14
MIWLRHLIAIAVLPFTVTVLIPRWIAQRNQIAWHLGNGLWQIGAQLLGVGALALGGLLFITSLRRFASEGKGTLAPWDPPRALVVAGPYRYVRNPMISGVLFVLFGEALLLLSGPHAMWALTFLVLNMLFIPLFEEPQLESRFGDSYREYKRHVPRVIPRLTPWVDE